MEHLDLIRKIAWSFHKTTGIDWEDLFSEASLAYAEGLKHGKHPFDSKKGAISTHMWWRITNHLNDYLKKQPAYRHGYHNDWISLQFVDSSTIDIWEIPEPFWEKLSEDSQVIARMILRNSKFYLSHTKTKVIQVIRRDLKRKGWNQEQINFVLAELKEIFSS